MLFYFCFSEDGRKRFEYATCGRYLFENDKLISFSKISEALERRQRSPPRPPPLPPFTRFPGYNVSPLPRGVWGNEGTRLNITLYRSTIGKTARITYTTPESLTETPANKSSNAEFSTVTGTRAILRPSHPQNWHEFYDRSVKYM